MQAMVIIKLIDGTEITLHDLVRKVQTLESRINELEKSEVIPYDPVIHPIYLDMGEDQ